MSEYTAERKLKYLKNICCSANLSPINTTWIGLGSNLEINSTRLTAFCTMAIMEYDAIK